MTTIAPWDDADGARRARRAFTKAYAAHPDGVWAAPGWVNLIGEHTDYNGGLSLPIALPHRTFVAFRRRRDDRIRVSSAQEATAWDGSRADIAPGSLSGWPAYVAGGPWALREQGYTAPGFDGVVESCVPYGAGLSSSAALECAVAVAIADAIGWDGPDPDTEAGRAVLVDACVRAENDIAGAHTGGMDQAASLHCQENRALLLDSRSHDLRQEIFDLHAHGLTLLVMDTQAPHALADGQYADRRATCEAAARALHVQTLREIAPAGLEHALDQLTDEVMRRRVRHVVSEIARVEEFVRAFAAGDMEAAGALMNASHVSLRDDYDVSCAELDTAVAAAQTAGALGARMTGGGFGGSAIALVATRDLDGVREAVSNAFAQEGFSAPEFLAAVASAAAGRVD